VLKVILTAFIVILFTSSAYAQQGLLSDLEFRGIPIRSDNLIERLYAKHQCTRKAIEVHTEDVAHCWTMPGAVAYTAIRGKPGLVLCLTSADQELDSNLSEC